MKNKKNNTVVGVALGIIFLLLLSQFFYSNNQKSFSLDLNKENSYTETIIISDVNDHYYDLANKIAKAEDLLIVDNIYSALEYNPKFIILVATPDNLDEERLLSIGKAFKNSNYFPALGIISGSTMEKAEELWDRRNSAKKGNDFLGTDSKKGQLILEPTIYSISESDFGNKVELNKVSLIETLQTADYFYWARHVSGNKWFWNTDIGGYSEEDKLYAKDIPRLDSTVIYTPSCGSFHLWKEDSIALGFVDNGAAAYVGNLHSPIGNGFGMRNELQVPGQLSWKEFPLGIIAQIQNRMALKTIFETPLFFMLGDPRIYLSAEQPYEISYDKEEKNKRDIVGKSDDRGVLAVKIDGGAEYEYIKINNEIKASESDVFYNNELQSLDLGPDKYLLFFHQGGGFEIQLLKKSPPGWVLFDSFIDALDHSWVVFSAASSPLSILFLLILLSILLFKIFKRKILIKEYKKIFIFAFTFSLVHLIYLLARVDNYSVSSDVVDYNNINYLFVLVGVFCATAAGLIVMRDAKKSVTRILGLILAVLPQALLTGFGFIITITTNILFYTNNPVPMSLWNYNMLLLRLIVLLFEIIICLVFYFLIINKFKKI